MDPATALLIGTAVTAGSTVLQGFAAANQAEAQAKFQRREARMQEAAAAAEEESFRRSARRLRGRQLVQIAKSGGDLSGSPLEVFADSAAEAELDAQAIRFAGSEQAARSRAEAGLSRLQARTYRIGGFAGGAGALGAGLSDYTRLTAKRGTP